MARNTTNSICGQYHVAWGKDHACGWFIQVFDRHVDTDEPIIDKDAAFDGLTVHELLELADTYNAGDAVRQEIYGVF